MDLYEKGRGINEGLRYFLEANKETARITEF